MTDEELANKYVRDNWSKDVTELKNNSTHQCVKGNPHFYDTALRQAYLAGLNTGRDMTETDLATIAYMQGAEKQKRKSEKQLAKAREIILKLYNAGRDVLMCRAEEKAYDNLEEAINDRSIEQFLKEIEE